MSGGSAAAILAQLVRHHYAGDDAAFQGAAMQLARQTKDERIRRAIQSIVHQGFTKTHTSKAYAPDPVRSMAANPSKMLEPLKPIAFPDLMLDPVLQETIDEILLELEYREQLAERRLRARNRLLFWGPPGNGKSSVGAAIGKALGVPAYGVSLPQLCSRWVSATGENLGEVFASIREDTVVVFDEIDAIGAERAGTGTSAGKEQNSIVNTLLTLLDRNERGILIATTNRPDILDKALLRRFDEQIQFPAPNATQMRGLSAKLSKHYGIDLVDVSNCINFDEITKAVLREARRHVMSELLAEQEEEDEDDEEEEAAD